MEKKRWNNIKLIISIIIFVLTFIILVDAKYVKERFLNKFSPIYILLIVLCLALFYYIIRFISWVKLIKNKEIKAEKDLEELVINKKRSVGVSRLGYLFITMGVIMMLDIIRTGCFSYIFYYIFPVVGFFKIGVDILRLKPVVRKDIIITMIIHFCLLGAIIFQLNSDIFKFSNIRTSDIMIWNHYVIMRDYFLKRVIFFLFFYAVTIYYLTRPKVKEQFK